MHRYTHIDAHMHEYRHTHTHTQEELNYRIVKEVSPPDTAVGCQHRPLTFMHNV